MDDPVNGHRIYEEMAAINPDFFVHTGDIVYYDKDYTGVETRHPGMTQELSTNATKARQRWNRMYAFDWNRDFAGSVASYYMKDDHDTTQNDAWPGQDYFDLTFEQGLAIFAEQTPSGSLPYRTRRWGKDLQIWLLEGRDYRSPNFIGDGPEKTILGGTQKAWLKSSLQASDATFKLVISPTPMVGPDKPGKSDNHANEAFQTEGDELRSFLAGVPNTFVVSGDRHWQYASIDTATGLREYGTGAINAAHDFGGNVGYDAAYHTYFSSKGGYLSVLVERELGLPQITFRYHDIDTIDPETGLAEIAYEETLREAGFGLVTITRDNVEDSIRLRAMTQVGRYYHIESSVDLDQWDVEQLNIDPRGSLLEFAQNTPGQPRKFYKIVETSEPLPESFVLPHTTLTATGTFPGNNFNRFNFAFDLLFETPATVDGDTDYLLVELGGTGRGTAVALSDGKLVISAGQEAVVTYTSPAALAASTRYSLRIVALSEADAGADVFRADLWTAGAAQPVSLLDATGLTVDGFAGGEDCGFGLVGQTLFSLGLILPTASPPAGVLESFTAYDPDLATPEVPLPPQPEP